MASAYGIIHQYGEPQSTFDAELAMNALNYRQQKFDANEIKIEQTLAQLGINASQIKNQAAKEHMSERANQLFNNLSQLRKADLSSDAVARQIQTNINSILDEKTIKHIGYGKQIDSFNAQMQTLKADNPEKFNSQNYQDALITSGLQEYIQGGLDAELGNLSYTPYVDKTMEVMTKIEEVKKNIGKNKQVSFENPAGAKITTTIDDMTVSQWMDFMPNLITPDIEDQIKVEARAFYGWNDEAAVASKERSREASLKPHLDRVEAIKYKLKGKISDTRRGLLERELASEEALISRIGIDFNRMGNTATSIGFNVIKDDFIAQIARTVGTDPSIDIEFDKETQRANATANSVAGGTGLGQGVKITDITSQDLGEIKLEDVENEYQEKSQTYNNVLIEAEKSIGLDSDDNKAIQNFIANGLTEEDAKYQVLYDKASATNNLQVKGQLAKAKRDKNIVAKVTEQAFENHIGNEVWEEKQKQIYGALVEDGVFDNIKILNDKEEQVSVKKFLNNNNVTNLESFNRFIKTEKGKYLKNNIFADFVVDSFFNSVDTNPFSGKTRTNVVNLDREFYYNFQRLSKSVGNEDTLTDTYDITDVKGNKLNLDQINDIIESNEKGVDTSVIANLKVGKNPTADYIRDAIEIRGRGSKSLFGDSSFKDDKDINNIFNYQSSVKEFNEKLTNSYITQKMPKQVVVQAPITAGKTSQEYTNLKSLAENENTGFTIKKDVDLRLRLDPSDPTMVIVSQFFDDSKPGTKRADGVAAGLIGDKEARVSLARFQSMMPNLAQKLDLSQREGDLNFMSQGKIKSSPMVYGEGTAQELDKYNNYFGDTNATESSMRGGAKRAIQSIVSSQTYEPFKPLVDAAIDSSDKFYSEIELDGNKKFVSIYFKKNSNNDPILLHSINMSDKAPETLLKIQDVAPQQFLTLSLQQILLEAESQNMEGEEVKRLMKIVEQL